MFKVLRNPLLWYIITHAQTCDNVHVYLTCSQAYFTQSPETLTEIATWPEKYGSRCAGMFVLGAHCAVLAVPGAIPNVLTEQRKYAKISCKNWEI